MRIGEVLKRGERRAKPHELVSVDLSDVCKFSFGQQPVKV